MLSIIIPFYNAEKHLRRCLDAIRNQTYGDFEVLLINDGSTDSSLIICSEYTESDSRFILHTIPKGGVTPARKFGLSVASNDVICFIDSDDIIDCDYIEKLYTAMMENKSDIVISGHYLEFDDKSIPVQPYDFTGTLIGDELEDFRMRGFISDACLAEKFKYKTIDEIFDIYSSDELRATLLSNRVDMSPTLWGKLIRKDLLLRASQYASDKMVRGEDCVMTYGSMVLADSITVIDYKGYHYIQHPYQSIKTFKFDSNTCSKTNSCLKKMINSLCAERFADQVTLLFQKSMALIEGQKMVAKIDLGFSYEFVKNEVSQKDIAFRMFLKKRYNLSNALTIGVCGAKLDEHVLSIKTLCLLAENARKSGKDVVFAIIGNGTLFAPFHGVVAFEGLEDRFRFICTNNDYEKMYPMLDYVANVSYEISREQCLELLESICRIEKAQDVISLFDEKERICRTEPPVLSINVLCYQVGEYLYQCLESIVRQTFEDFEVIVVNDGSTDSTSEIADYFAEHDSRFHVIHTKNRGVTAARKTALEHSQGEFIACVDGDDWIEPQMFEKAIKYAREYDCPMVQFFSNINKPSEIILFNPSYKPGVYRVDELLAPGSNYFEYIGNSLCLKVVKREIMNKVLPCIDDFVRLGEDCGASMLAYVECGKFYYSNEPLYHYRMRPKSITHSHDPHGYMRLLRLFECVRDYMNENGKESYVPYLGERVFSLITKVMEQEALYSESDNREQAEINRRKDIAVLFKDPRYDVIVENFKEVLKLGCISEIRTGSLVELLYRKEIPGRDYFNSSMSDF
ncbi:MAG: glycosyltransferase family 2 protein [Erysipelotrichaceae bacterium]|nr:glycosyltransferase family 2 protein [Erysipelotrichaceae bacterium]